MSQDNSQTSIYELADQFIALANTQANSNNSGDVGIALRYAAARYSAFEASQMSANLADDKEKLITLFMEDYRKMLEVNFDQYAAAQS